MNTQKIREAILDVIDAGIEVQDIIAGKYFIRPFDFTDDLERLRFCDMVIAKLEAGTSGGNGGQYYVPFLPIEIKP